jgi:hypothetical protein
MPRYYTAISALAILLLAPMAVAQDLPQARWLRLMPEGMDLAVAVPDLAVLEKSMDGLSLHPALTGGWTFSAFRDQLLAGMAEGEADAASPESLAAFLASAGVDTTQGAGVYYEISSQSYGVILALNSRDAAALRLGEIGPGEPLEVGGEDSGATFVTGANLGYFFKNDQVYLASSREVLQSLASAVETDESILLTEEGAPAVSPNEVVVALNLDTMTGAELATEESAPAVQGLIDAWRKAVNAAYVTIDLAADETQIRVLNHERPYTAPPDQTPAAAEASAQAYAEARAKAEAKLAPMAMMPFMPDDAVAVINLRLTKGLKTVVEQIVRAVVTDPAQSAQIVGGVNIALSMLGDEVAIALTDYTGTPHFLALAPTPSVQQIKGFLPMAGLKEPLLNEGGVDIFGIPDTPEPGNTLYIAPASKLLMVASELDLIKAILAAGEQPPANGGYGGAIPEELWQEANQGYILVQGDRVAQILNQVAPRIVKDPGVILGDLTMALRAEGPWNEVRLSVPDLAPLSEEVGSAIAAEKEEAAVTESRTHLAGLLETATAYAADHDGEFPPLSEEPGCLMMSADAVLPGYLKDLWLLVNPGAPDADTAETALRDTQAVDDFHYLYFSHAVWDDASGTAFASQYRKRIEEDLSLEENWEDENGVKLYFIDGNVIEELTSALAPAAGDEVAEADAGETVEAPEEGTSSTATEAADAPAIEPAQIPVFMERPGVWADGRIHVIYLDGSVQAVLPGTFPNTKTFLDAVLALDALESADDSKPDAVPEVTPELSEVTEETTVPDEE